MALVSVVTFKDFEPQHDYHLCRIHKTEETSGGLIIPEDARSELQPYCEIIASGPGTWNGGSFVETRLKPGDFIMPRPTSALMTFSVRGEQLCLVRENEVVGKVVP